ncbi:MAG: hypothetical protein ABIR47_11565 [Candidatus Kapaibacterium sp.]
MTGRRDGAVPAPGWFATLIGRPILWGILLAALVATESAAVFGSVLNHDVAWIIHGAGRWLEGARLYRDIVEINPPLIFYLTAPAVWLARALGLPEIAVFRGFLLALIIGSLLVCRVLIERIFAGRSVAMRGSLLLLVAILFFPGADFGEREHLMMILALPWFLAAAGRAAGRPITARPMILIALAAGVGLALKPFFLLPWIAVELYLALPVGWRGLRRIDTLCVAGVMLLYVAAVLLLAPEYLPLARMASGVYGAYDRPIAALLRRDGTIVWVIAAAALPLLRFATEERRAVMALVIAATGFLAGAFYQHKGWDYHFLPALGLGLMVIHLSFFLFAERSASVSPPIISSPIVSRLLAVCVALLIGIAAIGDFRASSIIPADYLDLLPVVRAQPPGATIAVLSTSIYYAFPLVNYSGARWGLRFNALWMLPGLYQGAPATGPFPYHDFHSMGELERYALTATVDDLLASRPLLVVVDRHPYKQGFGDAPFDFLEYFARDPRFAAFLRDYDSIATVHSLLVLRRGSYPLR